MTSESRPRPVLVVMALLVGLDVLTAGAAFSDAIGIKAAAFIVLLLAAVKAGMAFFLQGQVTPVSSPKNNEGIPLIPAR